MWIHELVIWACQFSHCAECSKTVSSQSDQSHFPDDFPDSTSQNAPCLRHLSKIIQNCSRSDSILTLYHTCDSNDDDIEVLSFVEEAQFCGQEILGSNYDSITYLIAWGMSFELPGPLASM